jgi:hypothetical protein
MTLYQDMQMYVDEALNGFFTRFDFEFKKHKKEVKSILDNEQIFNINQGDFNKQSLSHGNLLNNADLQPIFDKIEQIEQDLTQLNLKI